MAAGARIPLGRRPPGPAERAPAFAPPVRAVAAAAAPRMGLEEARQAAVRTEANLEALARLMGPEKAVRAIGEAVASLERKWAAAMAAAARRTP